MRNSRLVHLRVAAVALTTALVLPGLLGSSTANAREARPLTQDSTFVAASNSGNNSQEDSGLLELSIPTNATAIFGDPTIVNNYSITTGTLGDVQVNDTRWSTKDGWDLQVDVATFVSGANLIATSNLGLVPSVVTVSTTAEGIIAAPGTAAGSASYPAALASGAKGANLGATGVSVLNALLTLIAPRNTPSGTYTSTITLTLATK